jgi:cell division protein FtsB
MSTARAGEAAEAADLRHRALCILFWFIALSLLFNALFGDMGLVQGLRQRRSAFRLGQEVRVLRTENSRLLTDITALRQDGYRVEAIAREQLGLARPGEILFLFQPPEAPPPAPRR